MLKRTVLRQCLEEARIEVQNAPPDGLLAYLIQIHADGNDTFGLNDLEIIAIAYAKATQMNGGRG